MLPSQQGGDLVRTSRRRTYSCDLCLKLFESPSKLARHYLTHTGQKPFQCQDCGKRFRQMVHLERHKVTHTLPFRCTVCQRHFKNLETFLKHQQLHKEPPTCESKRVNKPAIVRKRRSRYHAAGDKQLPSQCAITDVTTKRKPEVRRCTWCDKEFPSCSKLERHLLIHTGQKPFICVSCGRSFRQKTHLKIHQLTHTREKPFPCGICPRYFKTSGKLLKHEEAHNQQGHLSSVPRMIRESVNTDQDNNGICPFVKEEPSERSFRQKTHLKSHQLTHTRDKLFQCGICPRSFKTSEKLLKHEDSHNQQVQLPSVSCTIRESLNTDQDNREIWPFLKEEPGERSLRQKSQLKIHQLTHTQDKLFQCGICPRSFKTLENLLTHEEAHSQQVQLPSVPCTIRESLNTDQDDSGISPFVKEEPGEVLSFRVLQCPSCEQCFETQQILETHTCFITEDGRNLGYPRSTFTEESTRIGSELEVASGKREIRKLQETEGSKLLGTDNAACHEHGASIDIFKIHPRRKKKSKRSNFDQTPIVLPLHLQHQDLGIYLQGLLGEGAAETTTDVFCISDRGESVSHIDSLHHFLQGAQGFFLQGDLNKCDQCHKVFPSISKLRRHYLIHTGQKPFMCTECGKNFRQSAHLKRHQVTHTQRRSVGEFNDLYRSRIRQQEHTDFTLTQDPITDTNLFQTAQELDQFPQDVEPKLKVEKEATDLCADTPRRKRARRCKARENVQSNCVVKPSKERRLRSKRTCTTQKDYKCSVCSKNFLSPSKLERHYLMHAGQRPFECTECGKAFRQDPHLKRHLRTHAQGKD